MSGAQIFTFDRFLPGESYGSSSVSLDEAFLGAWAAIFPDRNTEFLPAGILPAVVMRMYTNVITPRPSGNIHGSQTYEILRLPRRGERLATEFVCERKEVRKGRRVVVLRSITRVADEVICIGLMTSLVAA